MFQNKLTLYDTDVYKLIKFSSKNEEFGKMVFCKDLKCETSLTKDNKGIVTFVFGSNINITDWMNKFAEEVEEASYHLQITEQRIVAKTKIYKSYNVAHGDFEIGKPANNDTIIKQQDNFSLNISKIKVFISQPMSGLTDEEIINNRSKIIYQINEYKNIVNILYRMGKLPYPKHVIDNTNFEIYGNKGFEVIDNLRFYNEDEMPKPLERISKDINDMANADVVVVSGTDWTSHRGCKAEIALASLYDIPVYFLDDPEQKLCNITTFIGTPRVVFGKSGYYGKDYSNEGFTIESSTDLL